MSMGTRDCSLELRKQSNDVHPSLDVSRQALSRHSETIDAAADWHQDASATSMMTTRPTKCRAIRCWTTLSRRLEETLQARPLEQSDASEDLAWVDDASGHASSRGRMLDTATSCHRGPNAPRATVYPRCSRKTRRLRLASTCDPVPDNPPLRDAADRLARKGLAEGTTMHGGAKMGRAFDAPPQPNSQYL